MNVVIDSICIILRRCISHKLFLSVLYHVWVVTRKASTSLGHISQMILLWIKWCYKTVVNRLTQVHQEHDVKTVAAALAAFVCHAYVNLDYSHLQEPLWRFRPLLVWCCPCQGCPLFKNLLDPLDHFSTVRLSIHKIVNFMLCITFFLSWRLTGPFLY